MTLLQRAEKLIEATKQLEAVQTGAQEAHELAPIAQEISSAHRILAQLVVRTKSLAKADIVPDIASDLATLKEKVEKVIEAFEKKPVAQTLKGARGWQPVKEKLANFTRDVDKKHREAWQAVLRNNFSGPPPSEMRSKLAPTEKNNKVLAAYTKEYESYFSLGQTVPTDVVVIKSARDQAAQLTELLKKFDLDVPKAVRAFLTACASSTGAPLSFLTKEVTDWLEENKQVDSYVVRHRF